jgi:hypothetical protein
MAMGYAPVALTIRPRRNGDKLEELAVKGGEVTVVASQSPVAFQHRVKHRGDRRGRN